MRAGTEGRAGPVPEGDDFRRGAVQAVLRRVHLVLRHDCPHNIVCCLNIVIILYKTTKYNSVFLYSANSCYINLFFNR